MFENNINTTPADEIVSTTPATDPADTTNTDTTDTTDTSNEIVNTTPATDNIPGDFPAGYLADGYHATTDNGGKYLRPEFVGEHAKFIAKSLTGTKSADFFALLREMKRNKKRTLPFEARQTAALELVPKALALVRRKRAPASLVSFIKHNLDNIHDDADWMAFYRHLEAIAGYMSEQERGDS